MKKIILSVLLISVLSLSLFAVEPANLALKTAINSDVSIMFTSDAAGKTTITEKNVNNDAAAVVYVSYTSNAKSRASVSLSATKIASPTVASKIGYTIAVNGAGAVGFTNDALNITDLFATKDLTAKTTEIKTLSIDLDDANVADALSATDYVGTVTVTVAGN